MRICAMALPLAKVTILVGAGIVGSVLAAKEGSASTVSDFLSGAGKILWRQIKNDSSTSRSSTVKKPPNDALVAQVNNLRQELQLLSSNQPITIITTSGRGSSKYGVIIVIVVVGYGYVWWKGWKLPDMMFATRRSLSDACNSVSKKLENVYSSIAATKHKLSSQIDKVDSSLDNVARLTTATKEEVSELRGKAQFMGLDVNSVRNAVKSLETKISRIEDLQDATNFGVVKLCNVTMALENGGINNRTRALPSNSSRPTIEVLPPTPSPRVQSSRPASGLFLDSPSPSESSSSHKAQQSPRSPTISASGLQNINGISEVDIRPPEDAINGSSSSGLFGMRFGASLLSRTRSATNSFTITKNAR